MFKNWNHIFGLTGNCPGTILLIKHTQTPSVFQTSNSTNSQQYVCIIGDLNKKQLRYDSMESWHLFPILLIYLLMPLWWVDPRRLPDPPPSRSLPDPLQHGWAGGGKGRMRSKMKMLLGGDKNRELTYQLSS